MPPKGYKNIGIPEELWIHIDEMIRKYPQLGYRTVNGFCNEMIRNGAEHLGDRIAIIENQKREEKENERNP